MVRISRAQASSWGWLVVAAVVTGCYEPGGEPQASVDDSDGDGIKNTVDNCPDIANPNQRDFERDSIGDACDVCSLAPGDMNGDRDGVGDGCDPSNDDKNRLVFFDNFLTAETPALWQATGPVQFTADGVVIDTLSPLLLTRADASPVGVTMVALVDLLQVDSQSRISVVTNAINVNTYVGCELVQGASTAKLEARKIAGVTTSSLAPPLPTLLLEPGQLYLLGVQNQGTTSACIAIDASMNTRATTSFESLDATPSVGIRVEHARVRVRMAMLITKS